MQRLVRTFVGLSAAVAIAALSAPGDLAQAEAKQAPPATEKKQPPATEKKQPPAAEKKQTTPPAEKPQTATGKHVMVAAGDVKWGPAPPGLPSGAEAAVLDGDPGKAGMFTIRVKAPDGFMVPPHWHPTDEHLTLLSGSLLIGMGSKWDDAAMHEATTGAYTKMPRRTNHYVKAKGETIFQISAMGPFAITYVNASDDPRKKK